MNSIFHLFFSGTGMEKTREFWNRDGENTGVFWNRDGENTGVFSCKLKMCCGCKTGYGQ